jgi:hypothetical protein
MGAILIDFCRVFLIFSPAGCGHNTPTPEILGERLGISAPGTYRARHRICSRSLRPRLWDSPRPPAHPGGGGRAVLPEHHAEWALQLDLCLNVDRSSQLAFDLPDESSNCLVHAGSSHSVRLIDPLESWTWRCQDSVSRTSMYRDGCGLGWKLAWEHYCCTIVWQCNLWI